MCGIAGICLQHDRLDESLLAAMSDALEHRGPDEGGRFVDGGLGLAIRRLRVIDLETGSQPVFNEDGHVCGILNGEIYNFQELRERLTGAGHRFQSQSDTECLVHAYEEYGLDCLRHLRGMFAFALWDQRIKRLLLARDRLGKKPLVYACLGNDLYFASEINAVLQAPLIPRAMDFTSLGCYLTYGYVPAPRTIFRALRKLPAGHYLTWQSGQMNVQRYWSLSYGPKLRISEEEALEELETKLTEAVRLRMVADVPLGALLSGGVDSSLVVALMAQHSANPIKTFSIGFDDSNFDELIHARRVAQQYGTDHHELIVKPDAASVLPTLVRHYGEPYADSSAIPTFYVSKLARQHVTVALNGDGGDESFAGYDRYRAMVLAEAARVVPFRNAVLPRATGLMSRRSSQSRPFRRALRFLEAAALPRDERYQRWVSTIPPLLLQQLLTSDLADELKQDEIQTVRATLLSNAHLGLVDQLLATDLASYLLNDLLVKMDIASMANSLETRSPLLDQDVVEFSAQLPSSLKLHLGVQQKYLLKRLAARLIPRDNINRPKMGFGVPVGTWLRGPLRELGEDVLLSRCARSRGYFHQPVVARLWAEHQSGKVNHTYPLWTLLMFELWQREFVDSAPQPSGLVAM